MTNLEESIKKDSLLRKVDSKKASQELVKLSLSGDGTTSFEMSSGGSTTIVTLFNKNNLRLIGTAHITFYENSVAEVNRIPGGSNVDSSDFKVAFWYDRNDTDNNNIKYKAYIFRSPTASGTTTILVRINFRYIIETTKDITL